MFEVLVQLPPHLVHRLRRAEDARAERACEPLHLALRLGVVRNPAEPGLGSRDEQRAERRVDEVVRDVEQLRFGGGRAEARVKLSGNAHSPSFLRSRRIPADAACLAASAEESSATPISSYSRS